MGKLLSGGLILRSLAENPKDVERFPEFMFNAFEEEGDWQESSFVAWNRDLLTTHPMMSLEHVWCVVDPAANGKIVSGLYLIPQMWRYEGIEIPVARPEIVGTLPDYRRRGLVRELFNVLHEYSEKSGDLLQAITGIPYFYRQFGYGFAVDLGSRGQIPFHAIPDSGKDETAKFSLRPATETDIPHLLALDEYAAKSVLLYTMRDDKMWRYEMIGRNKEAMRYVETLMVVNQDDEAVGYILLTPNDGSNNATRIRAWVIGEQSNYLETFEDILRALKAKYESLKDKIFALDMVDNIHPVIVKLMKRKYGMYTNARAYAWYLRIPDHVAFIRKITPLLEQRLSESIIHNYSGRLRINFYEREDLLLRFESGKIIEVCMTDEEGHPDARFPFDSWMNVLFGESSETEVQRILPETMSTAESAILLEILFPKKKSSLNPIA